MFKRNKEEKYLTPEQKKQKAITILIVYGIFFIFLFIFLINGNKNIEKNKTTNNETNTTKEISVSKRVNNYLKKDNYEYLYDFGTSLKIEGKLDNDQNLITKTYKNNKQVYYINNNYYYILNDKNKFKRVKNNYLYEDKEEVFTNINNVINLLKTVDKTTIKDKDNLKEEIFYINLEEYLKIYNSIELTNYIDTENTKIQNSITYNDDEITITLDMSEVYRVINNKKEEVLYIFKIYNVDKVNIEVSLES